MNAKVNPSSRPETPGFRSIEATLPGTRGGYDAYGNEQLRSSIQLHNILKTIQLWGESTELIKRKAFQHVALRKFDHSYSKTEGLVYIYNF